MNRLLVFGPGYTARHIAALAAEQGCEVATITRATLADDAHVAAAIADATHILSSVPPDETGDPVLARHGARLAAAPARWIGYLSSTGVYGDSGGAWIDESAPIAGRRPLRNAADQAWLALHPGARVFRLPGIYGPGRSVFDRLREGKAHRVDVPGQVFSRIHVDDIARAVAASMNEGPPGAFNIADDLPAPQNALVEHAARLLGMPLPPLLALDDPAIGPMSRAFYAENRRVSNGRAKRQLGWQPLHPTYVEGLSAVLRG